MDNNKNILFKTVISGYRKSDVIEYIERENRRFAELEKSYIDTIVSLRHQLEAAEGNCARISEVEDNLAASKSSLAAALAENEALKDEMKKIYDEYDSLSSSKSDDVISQKDEEIRILNEKIDSLSEELEKKIDTVNRLSFENAEIKSALEKSRTEYHPMSAELGYTPRFVDSRTDNSNAEALLERAKIAAEDMLKRAETAAEIILEKARREALEYRNEIFVAAKQVFDTATNELRRSINACMGDFVNGISVAKADINAVKDVKNNCEDDLSRRIARMQNELDRAIAEKLAEFDIKRK